jgi:nitroreductase
MNDLMSEIANWCSVRKYDQRPIPDDVLRRILDAARRAPSWANVQSWHFVAVKETATKELLRQLAIGQKFIGQADAVIVCCGDMAAWSEQERIKQMRQLSPILSDDLGISFDEDFIKNSLKDPAYNPALRGKEVMLARLYEQLSLAIAFMILQAKHEGVGSCIIGAIANEATGMNQPLYQQVRQRLNLPDDKLILTLVTLGYPAPGVSLTQRPRKPFDEVVSREKYGTAF